MRFLVDSFLELISPTRCAGCEYPGELLCAACREKIPVIDPLWSCKRCGAPYGYLVCTECQGQSWEFSYNYSLSEFAEPLSRMIVLYKDHFERRLSETLGELLAEGFMSVANEPDFDAITWIPATRQAFRTRGFDHAQEVTGAFACAAKLARPIRLFDRIPALDQRELGRTDRAANVFGTFAPLSQTRFSQLRRVLIVDDVFTTGATLNEAARVLREEGVSEICTATLARVW